MLHILLNFPTQGRGQVTACDKSFRRSGMSRICRSSFSLVALAIVLLFTSKAGKHCFAVNDESLAATDRETRGWIESIFHISLPPRNIRVYLLSSFTGSLQFLRCLSCTKNTVVSANAYRAKNSHFIATKCRLLRLYFKTVVHCLFSKIKTFIAMEHTSDFSTR